MTEQIAALDALIGAVEAGDRHLCPFWKVWPPESKDGRLAYIADNAFTGSLDAAKALHDAVLPGWDIQITTYEDDNFEASVSKPLEVKTYDGVSPWMARAWLLAALKAYRAGL